MEERTGLQTATTIIISVAAPKISSILQGKFRKNFGLND